MAEAALPEVSALWADLPELIRGYPADKRDDARDIAYRLLQKFINDAQSLETLRYALTARNDLRETFYQRPPEWK